MAQGPCSSADQILEFWSLCACSTVENFSSLMAIFFKFELRTSAQLPTSLGYTGVFSSVRSWPFSNL